MSGNKRSAPLSLSPLALVACQSRESFAPWQFASSGNSGACQVP